MSRDVAVEPGAERRITWLSWAGAAFMRILASTWRVEVSHDEQVRRLRAGNARFILVLWHGHQLPLLHHHRGDRIAILISEHGDGEIIARIAHGLGYSTVRGSTSRGAARALLGLAGALTNGHDLAITPDGPRGPAKTIAPGALIVAQRTGAPLVAIAASASSAWRLGSWDSFMIPRPFARVRVAYSEPVYVTAERARDAASDAELARLREAMETAEQRANG